MYTYNVCGGFQQFIALSAFECIHIASEYTKECHYEILTGKESAFFMLIAELSFHHRKERL